MSLSNWKLEDNIQTKEDLFEYMQAAIEENDFKFLIIACKDVVKIARKKGFYTRNDYAKAYYRKNRETVLSKNKAYRNKDSEKWAEYYRKYYIEHKDQRRTNTSEYNHVYYMKKHNKTETRNYKRKEVK